MVALPFRRTLNLTKHLPTLAFSLLVGWVISLIVHRHSENEIQRVNSNRVKGDIFRKLAGVTTLVDHKSSFAQHPTTASLSTNIPITKGLASKRPTFKLPILIMILSNAHQKDRRDGVRKTWGDRTYLRNVFGEKNIIGPLFFVGTLPCDKNDTVYRTSTPSLKEDLSMENSTHGDIVLLNAVDDFRRLTEKIVQVFQYIVTHYGGVAANLPNLHILKTDDDAYVNLPLFVSQNYKQMMRQPPIEAFYCYVFRNSEPIRDPKNRYYVSKEEYPGNKYPPFCSGTAYLFTASLLPKILNATKFVNLAPMEDTYFTGIIAEQIGAQHVSIPMMDPFNDADKINDLTLRNYGHQQLRTLIHRMSPRQMQIIHQHILKSKNKLGL